MLSMNFLFETMWYILLLSCYVLILCGKQQPPSKKPAHLQWFWCFDEDLSHGIWFCNEYAFSIRCLTAACLPGSNKNIPPTLLSGETDTTSWAKQSPWWLWRKITQLNVSSSIPEKTLDNARHFFKHCRRLPLQTAGKGVEKRKHLQRVSYNG